jgi:hypothetical protein
MYIFGEDVHVPSEVHMGLFDFYIAIVGPGGRHHVYDFKAAGKSELDPSLPQEATIPATCGVINPKK